MTLFWVWVVYICRRLVSALLYLCYRFIEPLSQRMLGARSYRIGKCILLAPPKQLQAFLDGVAFVQTIDPKMFQRLTAEQRYVFIYKPKRNRGLYCREYFSITDKYLDWGKEGVALCLVQCILEFNLVYLPAARSLVVNREALIKARCEVQKQLFNWLKEHSFSIELVKQYEIIAKQYQMLDQGPGFYDK